MGRSGNYQEVSPPHSTGGRPRTREPEPEPESKNPWKSAAVIAVCVLLVVVLGWGAYKWLIADDGGGAGADPGASDSAGPEESPDGGSEGGEGDTDEDAAPPFETAAHEGEGFSVNYPSAWGVGEARDDFASYFNPEDETQWVRFYSGSERGLPDPEAYLEDEIWAGLPNEMTDLEQVRLEAVEIAGMSGSVLEYTGTNTDEAAAERHSIFAIVDAGDGTSYGIFISGDADAWELSQQVYDEAVASFQTG